MADRTAQHSFAPRSARPSVRLRLRAVVRRVRGGFRLNRVAARLGLILLAAMPAMAMAVAGPIPEARTHDLREMVRQDCGSCHGLRLTGGLGTAITPDVLAGRDPDDLAALILDGLPGTAMPGWRPLLSGDEARWIADYLLEGEMP